MINLTPIAEAIQKRLFQKMKLLGRTGNTPNKPVSVGGLTNNQLSVRSTFIRMSSGLEEPVILMGGELNKDGEITAGYDDIYGPRKINTYKKDEFGKVLDPVETSGVTENKFKRPMPGIKSIDVNFKGGQRAIRSGTVSWTCWSFEEIDRLMPHFLSVGKTVLLEWGWVYDENSIKQMPTFIGGDGIKKEAYTAYKKSVLDANGDFDMLIGIVTNFDYTTRADGGFDCTTKISSMGVNILSNPTPSKGVGTAVPEIKAITGKESVKELKDKLTSKEAESLVAVPNITLKDMVENIDHYCADKISKSFFLNGQLTRDKIKDEYQKTEVVIDSFGYDDCINCIDNQFVISYENGDPVGGSSVGKVYDVWVRWGWFEDNILSKFLTIVSPGTKDNVPISELRSINTIETKKGIPTKYLESVRIRNHPNLETTDINKYILPGQFLAFHFPKNISPKMGNFVGDSKLIKELSKMVNDKFTEFTAEGETYFTIEDVYDAISPENFDWDGDGIPNTIDMTPGKPPEKAKTGKTRKVKRKKPNSTSTNGYLRNMLINTKLIKQAFGVGTGNTVESFNTKESIESLFNLLNQDIPFWNFIIESDTQIPHRNKIIDTNVVVGLNNLKPTEKINSPSVKQVITKSVYDVGNDNVTNNGVFFFPVWSHESFVKSQNVSATVPSAMAISIMYGANAKKLKTAGANSEESSNPADASGELGNDKTPDKRLSGLSRAFNADGFRRIGTSSDSDNNTQITRDGGDDDLTSWASGHSDILSEKKKDKKSKRDSEIQSASSPILKSLQVELDKLTTTANSNPPPLPRYLGAEQWKELTEILRYNIRIPGDISNSSQVRAQINYRDNPLFKLYSSKYDEKGRMKQQFIDTIKFSLSFATKTAAGSKTITESSKPILLPINLEMEIDGIGGIFPGNSFHSTYLPKRYQEDTVFQLFDVNHTVSNSGWTVAIKGKMRSTADRITKTAPIPNNETDDKKKKEQSLIEQFTNAKNAANNKAKKEAQIKTFKAKLKNVK